MNRRNRAKKTVAFGRMALGPIWYSSSNLLSFRASVEHGGIPCIEVFVPRETHIGATRFWRPCDAVSENFGIAGRFWHSFCSSMLLPHRLLSDVPQQLFGLYIFHLFQSFNAQRWGVESSRNRRSNRLRRELRSWRRSGQWELMAEQMVLELIAIDFEAD